MSDDLTRPNDTIAWARAFLPHLHESISTLFTLIEWVIVIGFIDYLSKKYDSQLLDWVHAVLWGLVVMYAAIYGWASAPFVRYESGDGKWKTRLHHFASVAIAVAITSAFNFVASDIARLASQANE